MCIYFVKNGFSDKNMDGSIQFEFSGCINTDHNIKLLYQFFSNFGGKKHSQMIHSLNCNVFNSRKSSVVPSIKYLKLKAATHFWGQLPLEVQTASPCGFLRVSKIYNNFNQFCNLAVNHDHEFYHPHLENMFTFLRML